MAKRLSPLRVAYLAGYRRGRQEARAEMRAMAQRFDEELASVLDDIAQIEREFHRYKVIAIHVERHPDDWLQ